MALPLVVGEFGVVADPEIRFAESGKGWAKVRGVAKDRVRDSNGAWSDGDPTFIDIVCFGKVAENLIDSVAKGDSIIVTGKLQQQEWTDKETQAKRVGFRIVADEVGVSVKWTPAKTPRYIEQNGVADTSATGGSNVTEEPPF